MGNTEMKQYLVYSFIVFSLGCSDFSKQQTETINSIDSTKNSEIELQNNYNPIQESNFIDVDNAEIVRYDKLSKRFFLVIDSSLVFKNDKMDQIICDLEGFISDSITNLSFFNDKKWANYKDMINFKGEYKNWLDYYYLGEFNFNKRVFQAYPTSTVKLQLKRNIPPNYCTK